MIENITRSNLDEKLCGEPGDLRVNGLVSRHGAIHQERLPIIAALPSIRQVETKVVVHVFISYGRIDDPFGSIESVF